MSYLQILSVMIVFSANVYCNTDASILQKLEALDTRIKSIEAKLEDCKTDFEEIKPFIQGLASDVTELSTNFSETKNSINDLTTDFITIKSDVNDLEEISKLIGVETCKQLGSAGFTTSKTYDLDPDGKNEGTEEMKKIIESELVLITCHSIEISHI